jgi:hypothetical protein
MRLRHHAELALRQKQRLCVGVREWNCKNCFFAYKKKEIFFCFSPRTKGSKEGLRGKFQIATFPYGNAKNMFCNFVVSFF